MFGMKERSENKKREKKDNTCHHYLGTYTSSLKGIFS